MGSLVVKIDRETTNQVRNAHFYSDVDMFNSRSSIEGGVPMLYDVAAVSESLRNILMWRVGENILRPDFGHSLHGSMYEQVNEFNKEMICSEIKRAIEENEQRVDIRSVSVKNNENEDELNQIHVRVVYIIKGENETNERVLEQLIIGK